MDQRACQSVGIDLGTTNSSLAYLDSRLIPQVVMDDSARSSVPSVVFFDNTEPIVGETALKHAKLNADRVVQFIKIHMGDKEKWSKVFQGHEYTPEGISAIILRHLKLMAEPQIGPIPSAVITVPAYFNERRRLATQQAGEIAGISVIGMLNEPMAALLAYNLHRDVAIAEEPKMREQNVLVYDLGGGTFDVTIVRITPTEICELATDGNPQLGGKDWDEALIEYVANDFIKRYAKDPRTDLQGMQDLHIACEDAKRILAKKAETAVRINVFGHDHVTPVSRQAFEELTRPLLRSTARTLESVLDMAKLDWSRISRVLLVGGSTMMPAVREMLTRTSGLPLEVKVNPLVAVALGAATYAYMLECGTPLKVEILKKKEDRQQPEDLSTQVRTDVKMTPQQDQVPVVSTETESRRTPPPGSAVDEPVGGNAEQPQLPKVKFVTAHGIGLKLLNKDGTKYVNRVMIRKNTPVPAKAPPYRTQLDKPSGPSSYVRLEITQGGSDGSDDISLVEPLGEVHIKGLPPSPRFTLSQKSGKPSTATEFVDVSLEFDEQGRVQVSACYENTASKMTKTVQTSLEVTGGLKQEEMKRQRDRVAELKLYDP